MASGFSGRNRRRASQRVAWDVGESGSLRRLSRATTATSPLATARPANLTLLDLRRAPYVLYGVQYIGLVSLQPARLMARKPQILHRFLLIFLFKIALNLSEKPYIFWGVIKIFLHVFSRPEDVRLTRAILAHLKKNVMPYKS